MCIRVNTLYITVLTRPTTCHASRSQKGSGRMHALSRVTLGKRSEQSVSRKNQGCPVAIHLYFKFPFKVIYLHSKIENRHFLIQIACPLHSTAHREGPGGSTRRPWERSGQVARPELWQCPEVFPHFRAHTYVQGSEATTGRERKEVVGGQGSGVGP